MRSLLIFTWGLVKYTLVSAILTLIVAFFFPPAGLILGLLLLIGVFGAAWGDVKKDREAHKAQLLAEEWRGFDEQLKYTSRSMH